MVNSVRVVISGEDLASGPGTRLDHSRAFVWQSFIKVRKGPEKASDVDIRRGTESALLASVNKRVLYILNRLLRLIKRMPQGYKRLARPTPTIYILE